MKSFTLFTTDVMGQMKPRRVRANGQYEVIPAGSAQPHEERHSAAVARFEVACQDALLEAKVDRAVELMARISASRNRPIPDAPNAGPNPFEMEAQRTAGIDFAKLCADAEAAYAARNPHKAKPEKKAAAPGGRFTDAAPADTFEARCRAAQAAYAARNPHSKEGAQA